MSRYIDADKVNKTICNPKFSCPKGNFTTNSHSRRLSCLLFFIHTICGMSNMNKLENLIDAEMRQKLVCNMRSNYDSEHKVFRSSLAGNVRSGGFSSRCFISSPEYKARFYGEQKKQ